MQSIVLVLCVVCMVLLALLQEWLVLSVLGVELTLVVIDSDRRILLLLV